MEVHCLFSFLKGSDHMEARNQSAFGYIMNYTNTPTVQMAQALHIDASLVSKWKTGARNLSAKSIYFADVVDFFISLNTEDENYALKDAYASKFCQRMISLLNKGFHAKFILQYSDSKEDTLSFFKMCHQLIFHRNIEWFYYDNCNKPLVQISFYMLNSALSILCMSSCDQISQSCVY